MEKYATEAGAEPALFTLDAAARHLSLGRTKIYALIADGRIPTVRIGRRRLIRRADIEAFVAALEVEGAGR